MGTLNRFLNQTAVYWANPVNDGFGGYSYDDPVEVSCRWADKIERVEDPNGNEVFAESIIYSTSILKFGEYMYLGELTDMDSASQPTDSDVSGDARRIVMRSMVPSIKADVKLYKYYLK